MVCIFSKFLFNTLSHQVKVFTLTISYGKLRIPAKKTANEQEHSKLIEVNGSVVHEPSVDALDASTWQAHLEQEEEDNNEQQRTPRTIRLSRQDSFGILGLKNQILE